MPDDIRALSAALARDPTSLQYVELAEALRRRGKLAEALQVATHGLGRHPDHADGYDCVARIHSDKGELLEARMAWERVLALEPEHTGALKGVGFLYWRQGDAKRAGDALEHALAANPGDAAARRALAVIRGTAPEAGGRTPEARMSGEDVSPLRRPSDVPQLRSTAAALRLAQVAAAAQDSDAAAARDAALRAARASGASGLTSAESSGRTSSPTANPQPSADSRPPVFAGLEGATADMLLLDGRGLVMAGGLRSDDGVDVSELAAAALAGVSGEASRTAGYLKIGTWSTIVAEAEHANVILSPAGESALLMMRRDKSTPVGLAVRIADRARAAAARWLEQQAP